MYPRSQLGEGLNSRLGGDRVPIVHPCAIRFTEGDEPIADHHVDKYRLDASANRGGVRLGRPRRVVMTLQNQPEQERVPLS